MFAPPLAVVGLTLLALGSTLVALAWAWRNGRFDEPPRI